VKPFNIDDLAILVIEPSNTQLKIIINELELSGAREVEGFTDCDEALKYMNSYQPDLVASAMYFRDRTGLELLLQIRQIDALANTPFMLISSENRFQVLDPVKQAGVIAILPKPFKHEDLKRALKSTIDMLAPESLELESYDIEQVKALVVDDSTTARNHVMRMLNDMGLVQIQTAENGKEAIQILESQTVDIILTDYNMPEMDGCQLVEYIRNYSQQPYVPILMVTSEPNQARIASVQQAGVSAILDKPFEPAQMRQYIASLLSDN
jgi:two-component system, chemotaxis family, chemotaxis protein CheY